MNVAATYHSYANIRYMRDFRYVGNHIYYVSNEVEQPSVWRCDSSGGDTELVAALPDHSVRMYRISRDRSSMVLQLDSGDGRIRLHHCPLNGSAGCLNPEPLLDDGDVVVGLSQAGFQPRTRSVAVTLRDRDAGSRVVLVDMDRAHQTVWRGDKAIVPVCFLDGDRLVLRGARSNLDSNLYLLYLADGTLTLLTPHDGDATFDVVSGDARGSLLVLTNLGHDFTFLAELDLAAQALNAIVRVHGDIEFAAPDTDTTVWYAVNEQSYSRLFCRHGSRDPDEIALPERGVVTQLVPVVPAGEHGARLAAAVATPGHPPELFVRQIGTDAAPWTRVLSARRRPNEHPVVEPRLARYGGVPCLVYEAAPGAEPCRPVVLSFHGGPEAQERPSFVHNGLYQALLRQGIDVVAPNVRGSTGFGRSYQRAVYGDWGGCDIEDVRRLVAALRADPGQSRSLRLATFGVSYGGFLALSTAALLGDADVVAAAAMDAPSDLLSLPDDLPAGWRRFAEQWIGTGAGPERLRDRSPYWRLTSKFPPTLLIHGTRDPRVPSAQSDRFARKARQLGVEIELCLEDAGHGFTRNDLWLRSFGRVAEFLAAQLLKGSGAR